ncbi:MAG: 30S ribosomal protein S8 [Candidatus Micrarchaeia archaeon]
MDQLADAANKVKMYDSLGKDFCIVPDTKLIRSVMEVIKKSGYIAGYEEVKEGKFKTLKVILARKINDFGVVKPRFAVGIEDYQKFEARFIPSKDFGVLIISTPEGIMTNEEAKEKHMGGRLIAYIY